MGEIAIQEQMNGMGWDDNCNWRDKIVLENLIQWLFMSRKHDRVISVINCHEWYFPFILLQ